MFLRFIKDFSLKKNIKKSLRNYTAAAGNGKINTIGILTDDAQPDKLLQELKAKGLKEAQITLLKFKERRDEKEIATGIFTYHDITATGSLEGEGVKQFVQKPFDLLINYYKPEGKLPLKLASIQSVAGFKAGLSGTGAHINSLIVDVDVKEYSKFATELFKYLSALNKL